MTRRPRVGVSACLLGERVRYDGEHKRSTSLLEVASGWELVPVCPEVAAGLGIPRPPAQLAGDPRRPRMVDVTGADHTVAVERASQALLQTLDLPRLDGFVFKSRSPSCGAEGVEVIREGAPIASAPGLFAATVRRADPDLPWITEADLVAPGPREAFERAVLARAAAP